MEPSTGRRRHPWLRTIAALILLAITGVSIWYAIWRNNTSRRLAAAYSTLRAAGEPVFAEDLAQPAVPDARNAALLLRQAAKLIDDESAAWQTYQKMDFPFDGTVFPLREEELAALARVVDESAAALPLVARAAELNEADWQIDFSVGPMNVMLPDLSKQRKLANLLRAAALLEHARGNDAQAVEYARQIGAISRAVGTQPTLVSGLVSIGCGAIRASTLAQIAPSLHIDAADPRAVSPQAFRQLVDELLDDRSSLESMRLAMRGERAFQQDLVQDMLEGNFAALGTGAPPAMPSAGSRLRAAVLAPVLRDNALLLLRHMNNVISGLDAPDWPAYKGLVPEPPELAGRPVRYIIASSLLPSLTRASGTRYGLINDSRLAATALAIRWYAIDHDGRLPESLEELVPKYLPDVPSDALAGAGELIGYVADPERPRVYHVGANGIDDGGREPDPDATARENERLSDEVVHLRHQPRPATRPADE